MNTNSKIIWSVIISLILGGVFGYYIGKSNVYDVADYSKVTYEQNSKVYGEKANSLYSSMRKLWADHVFWTREYMIAAVNNQPNAPLAAERLLRNQEDIGGAVVTYYGTNAGETLTTLLKDHINIAVDIVADAKVKNNTKMETDVARWSANAEEIATLLSGANPAWSKIILSDMLAMHLSTTADELNYIIAKNYSESVTQFDRVFDHMMNFADALSKGIITQYPERF